MVKILLLDDELQIRRAIELQLRKDGYEVVSFENGQAGLEALSREPFDLLITDLQMPKMGGIELLAKLNELKIVLPSIVLTGYASVETAVEAMKLGASDYITKPPQLAEISLKVKNMLVRQELFEENRRLKQELEDRFHFDGIIGKSPLMIKMFERLRPLSRDKNISILLLGESGTGKEITAKAIHYNSPRKDQPYVAINCGALPENLLESELFGHEKGAFTDARELKKGLFETANYGTLFLDEIGSMPIEMQVKLLRAIEEREVRRVGGTKNIPLDLRFIAASNEDLLNLVEEGKFRQDLYFRLAVATVIIPPLRERHGDIELLAKHFLEKFNLEKEKSVEIDLETLKLLGKHNWKGNVRELENLIELQVVLAENEKICVSKLPDHFQQSIFSQPPSFDLNSGLKSATKQVVEEFEREFILENLKLNYWNISKTAVSIGISRSALHKKINQYDLNDFQT